MRFKNLLGLLAIGGAVAYAQKKRGGDLSLAGIKNSLRGVVDNVRNQFEGLRSQVQGGQSGDRSMGATGDVGGAGMSGERNVGSSDLGSVGGHDDIGGTYSQGSSGGYGSSNGLGTNDTGIGGSGMGRKY